MILTLFRRMIALGVPDNAPFRLYRNQYLSNVISWLGVAVSSVLFLLQGVLIAFDSIAFTSLTVGIGFSIPIFLNAWQKNNAARIFIGIYTPTAIVLASVFGKLSNTNPDANFETQYYDYRFFLMASAVVVVMLFDYKNKLLGSLLILYEILLLLLFDPIHNYFGVGYFQTGHHDPTYYFTNVVVILAFLGQLTGILFLNDNMVKSDADLEKQVAEINLINTKISLRDKQLKTYQQAVLSIAQYDFENLALGQIFMRTCQVIGSSLDVSRVSVWLTDESKQFIECKAIWEKDPSRIETLGMKIFIDEHADYFGQLKSGMVVLADDAAQNSYTKNFTKDYLLPLNIKSIMDIPIIHHKSLIGIICCEQCEKPRTWTKDDQFFSVTVSKYVSLAIETNLRRAVEKDLIIKAQELEEARIHAVESDKLKSAFLANISHEIRTPMQGIIGFSELLQTAKDPAKQKEYASHLSQRSSDLLMMLNSILDMAKLDAGQMQCEEVECRLDDLMERISEQGRSQLSRHMKTDIQLSCHFDLSREACVVKTDSLKLLQVFTNLIDNAIKFTASGSIQFGFSLVHRETLRFYVKDTGKGIAKDKINTVFLPFHQEDNTVYRKYGGTGLGLAIVKKLVALWGGSIEAESEEGKGTTFYFTMPYKPVGESS